MTNTTAPLIAASLLHLAIEYCAACSIRVPDTAPPLYIAVGPLDGLRAVLDIAAHGATQVRAAAADVEHDHSEGGHHD